MNYTTPEQSNKLLELKLSPKTADIIKDGLPRWSTDAIESILPEYIIPNGEDIRHHLYIKRLKEEKYQVGYGIYGEVVRNNLFEALYQMLCYLLEDGFINQ